MFQSHKGDLMSFAVIKPNISVHSFCHSLIAVVVLANLCKKAHLQSYVLQRCEVFWTGNEGGKLSACMQQEFYDIATELNPLKAKFETWHSQLSE